MSTVFNQSARPYCNSVLLRTEYIVNDFKSPAIFLSTINEKSSTDLVYVGRFYEGNLPIEDFSVIVMEKNLFSLLSTLSSASNPYPVFPILYLFLSRIASLSPSYETIIHGEKVQHNHMLPTLVANV